LYAFVLAPLLIAFLIPILAPAFAQEAGEFVNRKVEIWGLFYKFMTVAFTVGAAVTGAMVYIIVHFNEKNVKKREVAK
jgi:heme/copper-type cytochrome/quinol oxidase subunit 2